MSQRDDAHAMLWGIAHTKRITGNTIRHRIRRFFGGHVPKVVAVTKHKAEAMQAEIDALRARLAAVDGVVRAAVAWMQSPSPATEDVLYDAVDAMPADVRKEYETPTERKAP